MSRRSPTPSWAVDDDDDDDAGQHHQQHKKGPRGANGGNSMRQDLLDSDTYHGGRYGDDNMEAGFEDRDGDEDDATADDMGENGDSVALLAGVGETNASRRSDGADNTATSRATGMGEDNTAPPSIWSFAYYQTFFDVDTHEVLKRLRVGIIPSGRFHAEFAGKGDLYGPLWISTTLIFVLAMTGNVAHYFNTPEHMRSAWHYDFSKVTLAATTIYAYITVVPIIIFALFRFYKASEAALFDVLCLYGYSVTVFIVAAVLCGISAVSTSAQWGIIIAAALLSGGVLLLNLEKMIDSKPLTFTILCFAACCLGALSVGCKLVFFNY